jgi:outer membrane protein OmpA-like peptidoglycan-associated protein
MKQRILLLACAGLGVLLIGGDARPVLGWSGRGGLGGPRPQEVQETKEQGQKPFYQVTLVGRSVTAFDYQHRSGATAIDFEGTLLMPLGKGGATVESKQGRIQIDAQFQKLEPAQRFGAEYLTYVLWAVTPEGKPSNLGEVLLNGTKSKISVTTPLQSFGLIVTAEPYFAVTQPSNVVVLENTSRTDTPATAEQIAVNYELIERGQYVYDASKAGAALALNATTPLEVYEARNAMLIAQQAGADKYAEDSFGKAQNALKQAETLLREKADKKQIAQVSRDAVQTAADARAIALKREDDERVAQEKAAAAEREARAKADADAAAARERAEADARREAEIQQLQAEAEQRQAELARQQAETQQLQAEAQQRQAELERQQADTARLQAEQNAAREAAARAEAEAARAAAVQQQQAALEAAARAESEKQELRAALLEQFNRILPTRDTPRGLMVNISDVLFDTAKFELRPPAREALAKLSGIVLAHPGLTLAIEGHTDSTGTHEFNQKLSEQRAETVRGYLVQQGLGEDAITAEGFAETMPVADNATSPGRQQNRRVEIIVSGEVIGAKIAAQVSR